jgi:heat shock protein HslJ/uncharacterized lipoprotein YbaY
MMKIVKFVLLATALLALTACRPVTREGAAAAGAESGGAAAGAASETGATTDPLVGTGWTLATLNGEAPLADVEVTLNFMEGGSASGTDGCNQYSTSYTVDGDSITISPSGISTMMACPEPIMTQAMDYMTALTSAATFAVEGTTLTLMDGAGMTVATFAAVSNDLAGTSWNITNYNNGREAVVGVIADTNPTLTFGESGAVSGSTGCNNFTGTYTSDEVGSIEIGQLASTMMACLEPEGLMDQEMAILAALPAATVYTVQGSTLELRDAGGALQIMATRATGEAGAGTDAGTEEAAAAGGDASTADGMAGMASVTGTVYYLPRIALPNDAMVEVTIRNAQLADAPPEMTLLAQTAFTTDGAQVPLPFEVLYATADVQEGALYSIGARITDGAGNLLFISTQITPVITNGNPTEDVEILVSPVQ